MKASTKPIKIVLAEDEPMIALAYQQALTYHGFNVTVARDGKEALAVIEKEQPDLLLLDVIMPHMNGIEVLEVLRTNSELQKLSVIMLTNLGQPSDAERVEKLGARAYLIKANLSLDDLVRHISDAVQDIPSL
jgi:DNA-binding response OmpR family regulator